VAMQAGFNFSNDLMQIGFEAPPAGIRYGA